MYERKRWIVCPLTATYHVVLANKQISGWIYGLDLDWQSVNTFLGDPSLSHLPFSSHHFVLSLASSPLSSSSNTASVIRSLHIHAWRCHVSRTVPVAIATLWRLVWDEIAEFAYGHSVMHLSGGRGRIARSSDVAAGRPNPLASRRQLQISSADASYVAFYPRNSAETRSLAGVVRRKSQWASNH